ncbi:MAG: response regulator [candidate division Zixibacteria bacterium]|nr:response regulator [candidate division Zixibacteria bacterium]
MNKKENHILVVDDDNNLRELLIDTLDVIGYTADSAVDGIDALEKLKDTSYDLMISDIKMPEMDGLRLLQKTKRHYPNMPVIIITGFATPELMGRASPDGFLAKPFRISAIEQLIEEALAEQKIEIRQQVKNVMVVDDDDMFRQMLSETLRLNDFIPTSVEGGKEALKELENGQVDTVITDIKMPEMDGITLLKRIKSKYPDLPVILITGFFIDDNTISGSDSVQADGFLKKPFDSERIVQLLKDLSPVCPPAPIPG